MLLLQTCHGWQEPQESVPPQPSEMLPHSAPAAAQVMGWQQVPLPGHTWLPWQPQVRVPPQPSEREPHQPVGHMARAQHTPVSRQVCPVAQVPQLSVPPQPSEMVPQVTPCWAHVVG